MPKEKQHDLDFIVDLIDWEGNTDPYFKDHHYLEPIPVADTASEGYLDKWVVYGKFSGRQRFTAKELTVKPGAKLRPEGTGRLRVDHHAGRRAHRQVPGPQPVHDPLWGNDRGRAFRFP